MADAGFGMTDLTGTPTGEEYTSPEDVAALMVRHHDTRGDRGWRTHHASRTKIADVLALVVAGVVATVVRFNPATDPELLWAGRYLLISLGLIVVWLILLRAVNAYDVRVVGEGDLEYRRAGVATITTLMTAATFATLITFNFSRVYLAVFISLGLAGTLLVRHLLRLALWRRRRRGEALNRVLVIGGHRAARAMAASFGIHPEDGYRIAGVWWPDRGARHTGRIKLGGQEVPSLGPEENLDACIRITAANTVIVTDTELLGNAGLKALGWALQGSRIDLLLSPNLTDVAGPRMRIRPVAHLPLLHLDEPQYEGATRAAKQTFDRVMAALLLIATSPLFLGAALALRLTSPGPLFYRSQRLGTGGAPFRMLKFRTMVVGADRELAEHSHLDDGAGPMFKIRDDPRITPVGRFLRRYSIDELPQLINVLRGEMSLVGPRPPLPSEAEEWQHGVERRLLVPQGMTGLWQISGRSDLAWEDAVRLDLDYVENWSMTRDLHIIWHTIRAVIRSDGAY